MIKRKNGINNKIAFETACKNNDIVLSSKGSNVKPVYFTDMNGKKKILASINKRVNLNHAITIVPQKGNFNVGDLVDVYLERIDGSRKKIRIFRGTVTDSHGIGHKKKFTVQKSSNGVVRKFSLHSSYIKKVKVVEKV